MKLFVLLSSVIFFITSTQCAIYIWNTTIDCSPGCQLNDYTKWIPVDPTFNLLNYNNLVSSDLQLFIPDSQQPNIQIIIYGNAITVANLFIGLNYNIQLNGAVVINSNISESDPTANIFILSSILNMIINNVTNPNKIIVNGNADLTGSKLNVTFAGSYVDYMSSNSYKLGDKIILLTFINKTGNLTLGNNNFGVAGAPQISIIALMNEYDLSIDACPLGFGPNISNNICQSCSVGYFSNGTNFCTFCNGTLNFTNSICTPCNSSATFNATISKCVLIPNSSPSIFSDNYGAGIGVGIAAGIVVYLLIMAVALFRASRFKNPTAYGVMKN